MMGFNLNSLDIIGRINEIDKRLKNAESTVSTHDGNISQIISDLQNKQVSIENIVKELQNKQTQLNDQVAAIQQAQSSANTALSNAQSASKNAQTAYDQASKALGDVSSAYTASKNAAVAAQNAYVQANKTLEMAKTNLSANYKYLTNGFASLALSGGNMASEFNAVTARIVEWAKQLKSWSDNMAGYVSTSVNSITAFYNEVAATDVNRYIATVAILPRLGGPTLNFLTRPTEFVQRVISIYTKAKTMADDIKNTTNYSKAIFESESGQINDLASRFNNANSRFGQLATSMTQIKQQFEALTKNLPA